MLSRFSFRTLNIAKGSGIKQIAKRAYTNFPPEIQEQLKLFPSVITLPVQWGQQDTFQHLNNVDWLRFIESGRIDYMYLLSLYMEQEEAKSVVYGSGKGLIVKSQDCKYIHPVTYPDALTIATKVENLTKDWFTFYTLAFSNFHNKLVSKTNVVAVSYDHSKFGKCDFSEDFVSAVTKMEKDPITVHKLAQSLPVRQVLDNISSKY